VHRLPQVAQLKQRLTERALSTKGRKSELQARLQEALHAEQRAAVVAEPAVPRRPAGLEYRCVLGPKYSFCCPPSDPTVLQTLARAGHCLEAVVLPSKADEKAQRAKDLSRGTLRAGADYRSHLRASYGRCGRMGGWFRRGPTEPHRQRAA
jgi:hypothetical protein